MPLQNLAAIASSFLGGPYIHITKSQQSDASFPCYKNLHNLSYLTCLSKFYLSRPVLFHPWESTPLVFIHTKAQGSWWLQLWLHGVPKETRIDQVGIRVHSYQCKRNILKNPCPCRNSTSHIFHVVFKFCHIVSYMCFIICSPIFKSIQKNINHKSLPYLHNLFYPKPHNHLPSFIQKRHHDPKMAGT